MFIWIIDAAIALIVTRAILLSITFLEGVVTVRGISAFSGGSEVSGSEPPPNASVSLRIVAGGIGLAGAVLMFASFATIVWSLGMFFTVARWGALLLVFSPLAWLYMATLTAVGRLATIGQRFARFTATTGTGTLRGATLLVATSAIGITIFALLYHCIVPIAIDNGHVYLRFVLHS